MENLNDVLQHFGVRGMKWGVRRSGRSGQNDSKKPRKKLRVPDSVKKEWNSLSRERKWKEVLANTDKMTTKQINKTVTRIQMENDLKRLGKKDNVGSYKDRQSYLNRHKMTDQELNRKVNRLRAKDNLDRTVNEASRGQREFGKQITEMIMKASADASKN